ncbi:hypothetical protein IRB23SM22_09570 [Alkalibacterium sp. s-m-22]
MEYIIICSLILTGIVLIPVYIKYKQSTYRGASGNSFIKTVFNKGNYGEFLIYYKLEKMDGNHKLLTNLYIPKHGGGTTEIDLLMVAETGTYVFESKNYSGWIYGNENRRNWTQTFPNKKKFSFYNPIWQNNAHINALKSVTGIDREGLYLSYIIFSERCTLKKITVQSDHIKVIKRDRLIKSVKKQVKNSQKVLSQGEIEAYANSLGKYALSDAQTKKAHVVAIKAKR